VVPSSWPVSLLVMLPLMGGDVEGLCCPCTGQWIIADRRGNIAC
jgi:hypothetical protein